MQWSTLFSRNAVRLPACLSDSPSDLDTLSSVQNSSILNDYFFQQIDFGLELRFSR